MEFLEIFTEIFTKIERYVNKFLDAIDHLDFIQEYQVAYKNKQGLYEEMKNDPDKFDSFEEENRIQLIESILSSLEIIQDRCKANNRTQNRA